MFSSPLQNYLDAHKVTLTTTQQKGRSIFATHQHDRGSTIITSQPVALVSVSDDYCQHCFRQSHYAASEHTTLQRCSRCKTAYFCGMECFKSAWINYHRYVCGDDDWRTFDEEILERIVCSLIRYKQQNTTSPAPLKSTHSSSTLPNESIHVTMEAFSYLEDHLDDQPAHITQQLSELASKVLQRPYLKQKAEQCGISHADLVRFQSQSQCNAISVQDEHLFVVGEGLYPVASFFNHSCRPNAAAVFDGALLMIKAIEPIYPGEEITLAYIDIGRSRGYRQRNLRDRYFFTCDCVRCSDQGWLRLLDRMVGDDEEDEHEDIANVSRNNNIHSHLSPPSSSLPKERRKKTDQLDTLRQHINHWDLLTLSRQYDRLKNIHPDPSQPLSLGTFTHHMLQLFTPYVWSVSNPDLHYTNNQSLYSSIPPPPPPTTADSTSTPPISPCSMTSSISASLSLSTSPPLSPESALPFPSSSNSKPAMGASSSFMNQDFYAEFDDPLPNFAQPPVQPNYQSILTKAMETCLSFPVNPHSLMPSTTTANTTTITTVSSNDTTHMLSIPVFRISTLSGVHHLFYEAMENKHWPFAVKCGLYILIQYCFLYPPYHPTMAHHLMMLAKTGWNFIVNDRIREKVYARGVRRWIALAKETAKHAFGIHGCHYQEAVNLEWLFRREHQLVLG
ncbi:hypothetical protein BCR42DRAFT_418955 [Absidia repens]|uniref:SET domain-containing protein n=1 Tax=Absidia repens TaxID=90262 RepID=A0A1X2IDR1_9FUNG|nr:hypothetical protein BCR42DRAFT_418955 [Absidia repens]